MSPKFLLNIIIPHIPAKWGTAWEDPDLTKDTFWKKNMSPKVLLNIIIPHIPAKWGTAWEDPDLIPPTEIISFPGAQIETQSP
jgi:hypothetical protein